MEEDQKFLTVILISHILEDSKRDDRICLNHGKVEAFMCATNTLIISPHGLSVCVLVTTLRPAKADEL